MESRTETLSGQAGEDLRRLLVSYTHKRHIDKESCSKRRYKWSPQTREDMLKEEELSRFISRRETTDTSITNRALRSQEDRNSDYCVYNLPLQPFNHRSRAAVGLQKIFVSKTFRLNDTTVTTIGE
jgi:hypothetical protein